MAARVNTVVFIAGAVLGAFLTSNYYDARNMKAQETAAERVREAREAAAAQTEKYQEQKDEALENQAARAYKLMADNRALHTELARLRLETSLLPDRLANASHAAVSEYATAASDVFDQCVKEYSALAAKADGHTNDVQTLIEAWPRNHNGSVKNKQFRGDSPESTNP